MLGLAMPESRVRRILFHTHCAVVSVAYIVFSYSHLIEIWFQAIGNQSIKESTTRSIARNGNIKLPVCGDIASISPLKTIDDCAAMRGICRPRNV